MSRLQRGDENHLDKDWMINVVRYDGNYWVLNNRHFSALARCAELKFDSNGNPRDSKRVIRARIYRLASVAVHHVIDVDRWQPPVWIEDDESLRDDWVDLGIRYARCYKRRAYGPPRNLALRVH